MDIAIRSTKAQRVRLLKDLHPYLTPQDIAKLTGIPTAEVRGALVRKPRDLLKTRRTNRTG